MSERQKTVQSHNQHILHVKDSNERTATISKILNFSCVDGPGNRLVIFLQGCNYQCKSCHNPQTIDMCNHCGDCVETCPTGALKLVSIIENKQSKPAPNNPQKVKWDASLCSHCDNCLAVCPKQSSPKTQQYTVAEMLDVIRNNLFFISGITVTGGEATLQSGFIQGLFSAIKSSSNLQHLTCMIDSNGSLRTTSWAKLLPFTDGVMIDLKAWQEETHLWLTGRQHHRVLQSIELLAQHNKLYEVRLLHIPGKTDFDAEVDELASYLTQLPKDTRIKLNAFQHHGVTGEALTWETCQESDITYLANQLTERNVTNIVVPSVYL
ncbi:YjjW family glycine radical enzyme activase [Photobacterium indicum]|uniref:YjjW family glycine radical enzyme activase n=1 Tax=Photobacterium indicum TaxID=81447 RepID=UPI003D12282A